jgi:hypothetical protein
MYNKLKQGFIGKTMTQQQIVKWERARSKGRAMFVARFTLWCGTWAFVVNSLGAHYLMGVPLRARYLLAPALTWYTFGFLAGLFIWSTNERIYRKSLNAK